MNDKPQQLLKNIFGYNTFRPLQKEIISHALSGKDTLVIMPTGGGKSLCYQLPALILKGMTIVVSPLISLMKDQVEQLHEIGLPAVFLNSSLSRKEYSNNILRIKQGKVKLLYLAPETLFLTNTLNLLNSVKVDCLTIDEAHCISEWGHDFRPEYRQLVQIRKKFPEAVCMALTATATPRVQQDIKTNLEFKDSDEFIASFNRENLFLQIVPKTEPFYQIIDFLKKYPDKSGIIYCFSRRQVDDLCLDLKAAGHSVRPYHAGLSSAERRINQELFINDDINVIVATIAFGMGINKPDVHFVIHHDLPKNIESYYQQIGRAGRDGLRAHCLLLFSYGDQQKINYFIKKMEPKEQRIARLHLNELIKFTETGKCRRVLLLQYFGENPSANECGMCDNCIKPAREETDITIPAQMFLSCLKRTGELFGASHIIDVLRGSKSKKISKFNHQKLSTYGIGTDFSKKQWFHISGQLLTKDIIRKDPEYGSLKINEKGMFILKKQKSIMGTFDREEVDTEKARLKEMEYDHILFDNLKKKRKELADDAKVPPYVIFSDKTLMQMSSRFPQTKEDLLKIHGVGLVKMEKYGAIFLHLINRYCESNLISRKKGRYPGARPSQKKQRYLEVGEAYNRGSSIEELMKLYRVKQSTILQHLFKYLKAGYPLEAGGILNLSGLSKDQQKQVLSAFLDSGADLLRPVYESLNEKISYEELRILQLYYLAQL